MDVECSCANNSKEGRVELYIHDYNIQLYFPLHLTC